MTLVRFAPSPTGKLHIGNARIAVANWLFARKEGGAFLLRLDDTDSERSTQAFADGIAQDLTWLGLTWDRFAKQSDRAARYETAIEALKAKGALYPCYETAEELGLKRAAQRAAGRPPRYDRAALNLTERERAAFEAEGRTPHWRLKLPDRAIEWLDLVRGVQSFPSDSLSDPVMLREDGRVLYTLASVVDDVEMGVSHVIRGEDHVANTAAQIALIEALGGSVPRFAHLPLLVDAAGKGLSKRLGSLSLEAMREESGYEPQTIVGYLASLGSGQPSTAVAAVAELAQTFDIAGFGRAPAKFDPAELDRLNAKVLPLLPYAAVAERAPGLDAALWEAVKENLGKLSDLEHWLKVRDGELVPEVSEPNYLAQAAAVLPETPWDETAWSLWTAAIKEATGRKGKALFLPLRLALTARTAGPDMAALLPLIPRARVVARLEGKPA